MISVIRHTANDLIPKTRHHRNQHSLVSRGGDWVPLISQGMGFKMVKLC